MSNSNKTKSNPKLIATMSNPKIAAQTDKQKELKIFNRPTPLTQKLSKPKKDNTHKANAPDPFTFTPTADTMYLEVRQLTNNLLEARKVIKALREENRTLKRMQFLQDKAIVKMTNEHSDTPKILEALHEELRTAKTMNKTHIEKIAASEKALREIHQEYGKLKEKSERYHTIIRSKHLANSDVLQQRVEELTLQLKEKDNNEMLLEGQIEELEDEVRILKAQLSGDAGSVAPRSSKKNRRYSQATRPAAAAATGSSSPPHSAKGGHPLNHTTTSPIQESAGSIETVTAAVVPQTSVLKPVLKPAADAEGVQLQTVVEQPAAPQAAPFFKPKLFGK